MLHTCTKLNTVVVAVRLTYIVVPACKIKVLAALKAVDRPVRSRPVGVDKSARRIFADVTCLHSKKSVKGEGKIFSVIKLNFKRPAALAGIDRNVDLVKIVVDV